MLTAKGWTAVAALGGVVLFGAVTGFAAQQPQQPQQPQQQQAQAAPPNAKALAAELGLSAEARKQLAPDLEKLSSAMARRQALQSQARQMRTDMHTAMAGIVPHLTIEQMRKLRGVMWRTGAMGAMRGGARGGMMGPGMRGRGGMGPGAYRGMRNGMRGGMGPGMRGRMGPGMYRGRGMSPGMGAGPGAQNCPNTTPPADTTGAGAPGAGSR